LSVERNKNQLIQPKSKIDANVYVSYKYLEPKI